jgi:biopolymer transport protein TolR
MALSANDAFAASGGRGRRRRGGRGRRGALSEINVTPLVDVMLVLLIVFMISAPLLTVGVPVELPKTEAGALQDQSEPLTVSIRADGSIFVKEDPIAFANLAPRLHEMAGPNTGKPLYVRADGKAAYAVVAQVMAALSTSGFTAINLITDTGGPSSGAPSSGLTATAPKPGEPNTP